MRSCILLMSKQSGFLRKKLLLVKMLWRLWNDNRGFRILHKFSDIAFSWTWVWGHSGCWWWTGRPGVLQKMGLQRVGHYWATELTDWVIKQQQYLRALSPNLKVVLPWICIVCNRETLCYSLFVHEIVNHCGKLYCCLILRSFHSHANL